MATYIVNEGYSGGGAAGRRAVEASSFATVGEFVDFFDEEGGTVLRLQAKSVYTIERQDSK